MSQHIAYANMLQVTVSVEYKKKHGCNPKYNKLWKDFRKNYYQQHNIHLQDVSYSAINYMKGWCCIWHMLTGGCAEWKGIDTLSEHYRPRVQKLYGEMENVENEIEIDFIPERMKEDNLPTTMTVEEKTLFFSCLDGEIPESVIRSDEDVPSTIEEEPSYYGLTSLLLASIIKINGVDGLKMMQEQHNTQPPPPHPRDFVPLSALLRDRHPSAGHPYDSHDIVDRSLQPYLLVEHLLTLRFYV